MTTIQSAQVKYCVRLSIGQYQHEELEVVLGSGPEPSTEEINVLLGTARSVCLHNSTSGKKKAIASKPAAAQPAPAQAPVVARAESVIAREPAPQAPQMNPDPGFTAGSKPTKHIYPGFYYGYSIPYAHKNAQQANLDALKKYKQAKWDKEGKIWWTSVEVEGWDSYLVYDGTQALRQQPAQAEAQGLSTGTTQSSSGSQRQDYPSVDDDEIPF